MLRQFYQMEKIVDCDKSIRALNSVRPRGSKPMTSVPPSTPIHATDPVEPERGRVAALIGYLLLLVGVFTAGLSSFIAMIIAYDRMGQSDAVARTHFSFQLKIFWICFALSLLAGGLWISGLFAMLTSLPPPVLHHATPDAVVVRLAEPLFQRADVESWNYDFNWRLGRVPHTARLQMSLGSFAFVAAVLFSWIGPIFGLARLSTGLPIGHRRDQAVKAAP